MPLTRLEVRGYPLHLRTSNLLAGNIRCGGVVNSGENQKGERTLAAFLIQFTERHATWYTEVRSDGFLSIFFEKL
jgi:hypothetical protein